MDKEVKIRDPYELTAKVLEADSLLEKYTVCIQEDVREIKKLSLLVFETKDVVQCRKRNAYAAVEAARKTELKDSEAAALQLKLLQEKLNKYEEQERIVAECETGVREIEENLASIARENQTVSGDHRILSRKVQELVARIIREM